MDSPRGNCKSNCRSSVLRLDLEMLTSFASNTETPKHDCQEGERQGPSRNSRWQLFGPDQAHNASAIPKRPLEAKLVGLVIVNIVGLVHEAQQEVMRQPLAEVRIRNRAGLLPVGNSIKRSLRPQFSAWLGRQPLKDPCEVAAMSTIPRLEGPQMPDRITHDRSCRLCFQKSTESLRWIIWSKEGIKLRVQRNTYLGQICSSLTARHNR